MRELAFLLRSAGFSASAEELARAQRRGYRATVEDLLTWGDEADEPPPLTVLPPGFLLGLLEVAVLVDWWLARMIETRYPAREKLALFWHGYFTTSADPVFLPAFLLRQNRLFRKQGGGRFGDLLPEVARDPAMLVYLDGHRNRKEHPNENFARELLELFTLGVGNYSESDVREAARAFTGWGINWLTRGFKFTARHHDDGPKTFLGETRNWTGEEVLARLSDHPLTARHLAHRLFLFFAGATPSLGEEARLAGVLRAHHGEVLPVLRELFLGEEFRRQARSRSVVRSPVELVVGACRCAGISSPGLKRLAILKKLGELPFLPPNVSGWEGGAAWINSASLPDRWELAAQLAQQAAELWTGQSLEQLLAWGGQSDLSEPTRKLLMETWEQHRGPRRTAECLTLLWASPEGQMR